MNPNTSETTGLLPELFSYQVETDGDMFVLDPTTDWYNSVVNENIFNLTAFQMGALACKLQAHNSTEICLFESTTALLDSVNSDPNGTYETIVGPVWMYQEPMLLTTCSTEECPQPKDPAVLKAMYFMRAMHSSVWSLIFLYILTAGSLLFLFETTHLFRIGKPHQLEDYGKDKFNLFEALMYTALGMVLQPHRKSPKSWAGQTLAIFWHCFCLVCIIAYILGTSQLIFESTTQVASHNTLYLSSHTRIACERHSLWCTLLAKQEDLRIQEVEIPRDAETGELLLTSLDPTVPLLTDHLTASLIRGQIVTVNDTGIVKHMTWLQAQLECTQELKLTDLPLIPLTFSTTNTKAAWIMNVYIQKLRQSGKLNEILERWIHVATTNMGSLCRPDNTPVINAPIRLEQMNGPLLFMIIGAFAAALAHFAEFFYLSFIHTDSSEGRRRRSVDSESRLVGG
ncbi:hypothetical protein EG68_04123 [Paragonimus skrjabini miyazakii]|uniref:Ionotropic glutamate receptor C-terminal domain-containing protein n=1 Tax=Paragonimus skrjabini miyazakii TaxID=59628 RepID=A0A8S9Z6C9_9TREM|nr:hypothetical protein EG68_04123 [Paragonimus skrjabini miyazakii]